jgi:hypothetical protein
MQYCRVEGGACVIGADQENFPLSAGWLISQVAFAMNQAKSLTAAAPRKKNPARTAP